VATGKQTFQVDHQEPVVSLDFDQSGRYLVFTGRREITVWDLAGKAYGVPVYQMLGGKYRDRIRCYCDTPDANDPKVFGDRMKKRAFPSSVSAQKHGDLSRMDLKRYSLEDMVFSNEGMNPFHS
jgi:L-alanine-DL-glutamate epimerase-like enolase superfamily enzyme